MTLINKTKQNCEIRIYNALKKEIMQSIVCFELRNRQEIVKMKIRKDGKLDLKISKLLISGRS